MWRQEVHRRNAEGRAATKKRKVEENSSKTPMEVGSQVVASWEGNSVVW